MYSFSEFRDTIQTPNLAFLTGIIELVHQKCVNIIGQVKQFDYQGLAIKALMYYTIATSQMETYASYLYSNYPFVKDAVDKGCYVKRYITAQIYNAELEPLRSNWICTSMLLKRDPYRYTGDAYSFLESYEFMNLSSINHETMESFFVENYKEAVDCGSSFITNHKYIKEILITMKVADKYIYTTRSGGDLSTFSRDFFLPKLPLKYNFLSIEYKHPFMKKAIVLNLSPEIYYEKNEILSMGFVKRALDHQMENYVFDDTYILHIVDSDIHAFVLKSNQYVVLEESAYKIVDKTVTVTQGSTESGSGSGSN
jgi:hypothetical protein